ncbi:MAG TPA: COX15/CtaA family protein [Candidatus Deferrimicrobiaceae bacterium]|jgi:heme A synthase
MIGRVAVGLFFLLLIWGNLVAGMEAGLGCPDWPLCHGRVIPPGHLDTWMEFGHRLIAIAATLSLVLLARIRFRSYAGRARAVPVGALALIAVEIVLGGVVVLLELPADFTTIHFAIGLSVFLLVCYMAAFDGVARVPRLSVRGLAGLFFGIGALLFIQLVLGAFVRHSDSGLACTDFPTCAGSWLPAISSGKPFIQFVHRLAGYLVFLTTAVLCIMTRVDDRLDPYREDALALLAVCLLQIAIGVAVVLSHLVPAIAAVHLAVALGMIVLVGKMWARAAAAEGAP